MKHPGSAARVSSTLGSNPTMEVCRRGNPGFHVIILATGGPRASHRKRAPHVLMHTQNDNVHLQVDAAEFSRWINNPLVSDSHGEVVWGQTEAVPDCGVSREHRSLHLIFNLPAQPDKGMPSVNNTTDREFSP